MIEFELIKGDYIELVQLLKVLKLANSGGEAKMMVEDKLVKVNGKIEQRKRAKLYKGDIIEIMEQKIVIK